LSSEKKENFGQGTLIKMVIPKIQIKFQKRCLTSFRSGNRVWKDHSRGRLSGDPSDPHISRSQAKRLLMGLEKFKQVVLDFKGVSSVGQAFVDEVFRVFQNEHPDIAIQYFNANLKLTQ